MGAVHPLKYTTSGISEFQPGDYLDYEHGGGAASTLSNIKNNLGLSGLFNASALQGYSVSSTAPSTGQSLTWDGNGWIPSTIAGGGGGGETNTASNLLGIGLFSSKSGVDLRFKGLSGITNVSITSLDASSVGLSTIPSSISHTQIVDIGTNTHAQIDSHITSGSVHFPVSSIDHGSITGLSDDDHTQYLLATGARYVTSNFNVSGN